MKDIAIVGMAARLPGASSVSEFWGNLCKGIEAIRDVSEDELRSSGIPTSIWERESYVRRAAFPKDVEYFDAQFFGFTPSEAAIIDPQHRLLLECAHEALEDAGQDPERYTGQVAVFAGCALNTYLLTHLMSFPDLLEKVDLVQLNLASSPDFLATRISYKLGLRGISHTVQCACSTSLVAVHLACQSLLSGESDMALAGGAALNFHLRSGYLHVPGGMFSATGVCRAFDKDADGTMFGNGAGMVALKRHEDALRDRDQIYAIVKGSAVNNDGAAKVGYTAPSVEGQSLAIAEAMANAGVSPAEIGYIETHGTGTPLGDPIEIEALARAFQTAIPDGHQCLIGSVKTNIGHLDCAAGVSGFIKATQIVHHGVIPPSLHFVRPNPHIAFESTPFKVNDSLTQWETSSDRRIASVSAFGVGGTNAHVVLESVKMEESVSTCPDTELLIYSALTETALDKIVSATREHLVTHTTVALHDTAFTLATGRRQLPYRFAEVVVRDLDSSGIETVVSHRTSSDTPTAPPPVVFMFPGQGAQTLSMGQQIYTAERVFRESYEHCFDLLSVYISPTPRSLSHFEATSETEYLLQQTNYAQPLLFAFEYSLAQLWISWGVNPDLMIGHSLGEYVAATIAGTLSLEEALRLVTIRGKLMQTTERGAMLSIPLGESEANTFLSTDISLAAVNSHSQCVLSGREHAISMLQQRLETDGIHGRKLPVSRAFHSPLMDPILDEFRECLAAFNFAPPRIPWVSNLTGTRITSEQAVDPEYWTNHLRNTVRFLCGLKETQAQRNAIFLEVGPQRTLQQLASRLPLNSQNQVALSSTGDGKEEYQSLLSALGNMWVRGVPIDWTAFYKERNVRRTSLPTYPFERQRCWIERPGSERIDEVVPVRASSLASSDDYKAIPVSLNKRPRLSTPYVAPSTPTESKLASILEPVLGIRPLGVRDNFFALGTDSLMAISVVSQLKEQYGVQLTAVHLYEALDIASLARIIDEMVADSLRITTSSDPLPIIPSASGMA